MTEWTVFSTALTTGFFFLGTTLAGRAWLAYRHRHLNHQGGAPSCAGRREEAEAERVLQKVRVVVPDLDLDLLEIRRHR